MKTLKEVLEEFDKYYVYAKSAGNFYALKAIKDYWKSNTEDFLKEMILKKKSILEEAAYSGGVPKKWLKERGQYVEGYNSASDEQTEKFSRLTNFPEWKNPLTPQ